MALNSNYYKKCNDKTAFNKENVLCEDCSKNCKVCQNPTICMQCDENYFLFQNQCVENCPDKYYGKDGECKGCKPACSTCQDGISCNLCIDKTKDPKKLCCQIQYCEEINKDSLYCECKKYTNEGICRQQQPQCQKFSDYNGCICSQCKGTLYLLDNECITQCPSEYGINEKTCKKCNQYCQECQFKDNKQTTCTKCIENFVLQDQQCQNSCNKNYFSYNNECKQCDSGCNTCEECKFCKTQLSICNSCVEKTTERLNISNLKSQFFCLPSPITREQAGQKCQQTQYPYLFEEYNQETKKYSYSCVQYCPFKTTYFKEPNFTSCKACLDVNCSDCYQDYKVCNSCINSSYKIQDSKCVKDCDKEYYLKGNVCLRDCGQSYYKDLQKQICQSCIPNCELCSDSQSCQKCQNSLQPFYLDQNKQCVSQCSDGYYLDSQKCSKCSSNCEKCFQYSKCLTCNYPDYLFDDTCVKICPKEKQFSENQICVSTCTTGYPNKNNKCSPCNQITSCQICQLDSQNNQQCKLCKDNTYLDKANNQCVEKTKCPTKTYPNDLNSNKSCDSCLKECLTCSNGEKCDSCLADSFLINNRCGVCTENQYYSEYNQQCVSTCLQGYAGQNQYQNRQCLECSDKNCKQCTLTGDGKKQKCLQCITNKYLINSTNSCMSQCPEGFYPDNSDYTCKKCSDSCKTCYSFDNCSSCNDGLYLSQQNLQKYECVSSCSDYFYFSNGQCKKCKQSNCLKCDEKICKKCDNGSVLVNNECVLCPSEQYLLDKNCQFCENKYLNLNDQICINGLECKNGSYIENGLCKKCYKDLSCSKASSDEQMANCPNQCRECSQGLYLLNGFCKPCPPGCINCQFNQKLVCTVCEKENYCLIEGKCIQKDDKLQQCQDMNAEVCIQNPSEGYCLQCQKTFPSYCLICDENSYLFNSKCYKKCPVQMVGDRNKYEKKNIYSGICRDKCMNDYIQVVDEQCFYCPQKCECSPIKDKQVESELKQDYSCNKCDLQSKKIMIYRNDTKKISVFDCVSQCPDGHYDDKIGNCMPCDAKCQVCNNQEQCSLCKTGYFLNESGKCNLNCEEGYFKDYHTKKCQKCENDCAICPSQSFCEKCQNQQYLYQNKCYSTCPKGYGENNECKSCINNCELCKNGDKCEKCIDGTYLQRENNQVEKCVSQCNNGFYPSLDKTCQPCGVSNCERCLQNNKCEECINNYYLQSIDQNSQLINKCEKKCDVGYFENTKSKECTQCPPGCLNCPNGICEKCQNKYYLNNSNICIPCNIQNCLSCTNSNLCEVCEQPYYLNDKQECVSDCPNYYFKMEDRNNNNKKICKNCISKCVTCEDITSCKVCDEEFYFDKNLGKCQKCLVKNCNSCQNIQSKCEKCSTDYLYKEDTFQCLLACPEGYFIVSNNQQNTCQKCVENCGSCSNKTECKICKNGFYLKMDSFDCVQECPIGYGIDQKNKQCFKCSNNCLFCENTKECLNCNEGYFLDESLKCTYCEVDNCKKCYKESNFCEECKYPYYLKNNNECLLNCPLGYTKFIENRIQICQKCIDNCQQCDDTQTCGQCEEGYSFYKEFKKCYKCEVDNCNECQISPDQCTKCKKDLILDINSKQCLIQCPEKQYVQEKDGKKICQHCSANCNSCENSDMCNTCKEGYYKIDGTCIQCQINSCGICSQSETICDKCNDNLYLSIDKKQCKQNCSEVSEFHNIINKSCESCTSNCLTCSSSQDCSKCEDGYFLKQNKCIPCDSKNCISCKNTNMICDECDSQYNLSNDKKECVHKCPIKQFQTTISGILQCQNCIDNCQECNNDKSCLICLDGFFLNENKQCVNYCPERQYANNESKECLNCPENCLECKNSKECNICAQGMIQSKNTLCYKQCLKGYYQVVDSQNVISCIKCSTDDSCEECENGGSCKKCSKFFVYDPQERVCKTSCDQEGYIAVSENDQLICKPCTTGLGCKVCLNSDTCQQCNQGYAHKDGKCVQDCGVGYFKCSQNKCLPQNSNQQLELPVCLPCNSNCDSCIDQNQCDNCMKGFYLNDNKSCTKCSQGCLYCSSKEKCKVCEDPLMLNQEQKICIQKCDLKQNLTCDCSNIHQCSECDFLNKQCVQCQVGYKLQQNKHSSIYECIKICDEKQKFYPQNDICIECKENEFFDYDKKQCQSCQKGCLQCSIKEECDKCDNTDGYFMKDKNCQRCKNGEYIHNQDCKLCVKGCDICQETNSCIQCKDNHIFDDQFKICVQICDKNTNISCECQGDNCKKCDSIDKKCLQCEVGYELKIFNNQEVCSKIICSDSQFELLGKCINCDPICKTCSKTSNNCTSCSENKVQTLIQNSTNQYTCSDKQDCHYTCINCRDNKIDSCLSCNDINRVLYMNRCICKEGYIENASKDCQKTNDNGKVLDVLQSGISSISAIALAAGAFFPSSFRGLEVSQMVSYQTYVNVEYEGKSDLYLRILYSDNLSPMMPNILSSFMQMQEITESNNKDEMLQNKRLLQQQVFVDKYQETQYKFMKNSKTNNFIYNISPLILLHLFIGFLLLTKILIFKYTKLQYSNKTLVKLIKNNFRITIFLLVFYLTYQELLFIILLQLQNSFEEQPLSIIGSVLALLSIIYIAYLLQIIVKTVLLMPYLTVKEKGLKFGPLFYGLKDTKMAQIFILIKIIQKTVICLCIVYAYNSEQLLPQIVIAGLILLYEIIIIPFQNKLISISSLILNSLYLILLVLSYLIKSEQDNLDDKQTYSKNYELLLLTYIIVKNLIVLFDIFVFLWGMIKFLRKRKMGSSESIDTTSTDLENSLSKQITWRNNPLIDSVYSVKLGKQEQSDLTTEFRSNTKREEQSNLNHSTYEKINGSPNQKQNKKNNSDTNNIDETQNQGLFLGKESLIVSWKKNKLYQNENNQL